MKKSKIFNGNVKEAFNWLIKEANKNEEPYMVFEALQKIIEVSEQLTKWDMIPAQKFYFSTKDFVLCHPTSPRALYMLFKEESEFYSIVIESWDNILIYQISEVNEEDIEQFEKQIDTIVCAPLNKRPSEIVSEY